MARVNINILGISELNGLECLRRSGVAIMVNKSAKYSTWMQSQKRQNYLCSFPRQIIHYHGNLSLCPDQQHQQN